MQMANALSHDHFSLFLLSALLMAPLAVNAAQHTVGSSAGWTIPAVGDVNYSTWAGKFSFSVGDILVFKYDATLHNVLQVSEADYDNCSVSTPQATYDSGNTVVTLDKAGMWGFICGVPGHCLAGQKLEVQVELVPPSQAPFVPLPSPPSPSPLVPSPTSSPPLMSPSLAPSPPPTSPSRTDPSMPHPPSSRARSTPHHPASNAPPLPSKITLLVALIVGPWLTYAHFL